ncbi:glutamyl-tRNA reductase [Reichenbachiella sp. MALMAid0571]|uniref:glutamyl-tRNA reductase n=1 Tax=Reichenbachiella sp. MALMAid0571 TaxID=3143939 RepID=UPI0032DE6DE3
MHKNFKAISLSFKNAPLGVRELVAFDEQACKRILRYFDEFTDISEALVVSTCNRTEIYYTSPNNLSEDIIKLIGLERNIKNIADFSDYFIEYNDYSEAVEHLFYVSIGLEAQVVGDLQIINQVKNAYQWSADENMAGPFLHRLMHTIFYTNKRVVQETAFRDGAASVSYVTVDLVNELTVNLECPNILVLGLGEIGEDVCRNLENIKNKNVLVCNRTFETAKALADECGYGTIAFSEFKEKATEFDVIISSIAANDPIITKSLFKNNEVLSHKYLFDLSVPRSIEQNVEDIPGVLLYNIDNIQSKASVALEKRLAAIPDVKAIINLAIDDFNEWSKEMEVSPVINKLSNALEEIRQSEVARHIKGLNDKESEMLEKVTKSMMQKIIKLPILQLKAACKRGEAESLIDVLNDLFNLEAQPDKVKK